MQILTKNQALFIAEQIAAVKESDLLELNIDCLVWRLRVPLPGRKMMTWITASWEGYIEASNYGAIRVEHPDPKTGGEVHESLTAFRQFYRLSEANSRKHGRAS